MITVSERLSDKIEITILKLQNLQTVGNQVMAEQAALIEEARKEVGAAADAKYDHPTKSFQVNALPFRAPSAKERKRAKA